MIKGVNRQMIEVTHTGSPYFERAFLLLRPDCTDPDLAHLQEEARRMLTAVGGYSALDKNRRRARNMRLLWSILGTSLGSLLGLALARRGV